MKPATATLLVLAGLLIATAQAAEPETVTLACEFALNRLYSANADPFR